MEHADATGWAPRDRRPRLLVVDDEPDIVRMLASYFSLAGYDITTAADGEAALAAAPAADCILLDVNMPGMDGFEVCRRIREHVDAPVIFLTARVEDVDQLDGFAAGGDDYVLKPFSLAVLASRVKAHLARAERRVHAAVRFFPGLTIDYAQRTVEVVTDAAAPAPDAAAAAGEHPASAPLARRTVPVDLTRTEFDIVALLSKRPGHVYDRETVYRSVWGWEAEGDPGIVREHIRRIRRKLVDAGCAYDPIATVWGVGYTWSAR